MRSVRILLVVLCALLFGASGLSPRVARADEPPQLLHDLDAVADWLAAKKAKECTERCLALTKLTLTGVSDGAIGFTLEGSVLAEQAQTIPLFGPPNKVRVENVEENGKPAAVGFEGDHYFVSSSSKHFVLKGTLHLDSDLSLTIAGPLNTLDVKLEKGRVIEGAQLSGLAGTTLHFEAPGAGEEPAVVKEPPVFLLSRAIRVLRETSFEYRLTLRSGTELGVVRLPLSYGEKVLDVGGATTWKVEGTELVIGTAGTAASIVVNGTLPSVPKSLAADARSPYEWWLVESDPEHRVITGAGQGSAKQVDTNEAPLARTQPNARLFLAHRGETLSLDVQTLASVEALAAVVREHVRTAVLTARGDWVFDDTVTYENNGVDYMLHTAAGRPIFLANDGVAERLLHRDGNIAELMIALQKGQHSVRVQSVGSGGVGKLFGVVDVPTGTEPLTTSRTTLTLGLPVNVHPLALLGGDRPMTFVGDDFAVALAVAFVVAFFLAKSWRERLLITAALYGTWFVLPPLFVLVVVGFAFFVVARAASRLLRGKMLVYGRWALGGAALLALVTALGSSMSKRASDARPEAVTSTAVPAASATSMDQPVPRDELSKMVAGKKEQKNSDLITNAPLLPGVAPVAMPLPSAARWVSTSRELCTPERPFHPRLVYVTTYALLPFALLWALAIAALAWLHRAELAALRDHVRKLLAPAPADAPPAPAE